MLNLKNKTALVTGGGTGIGQSIALHLAQEGCHLVLTGLGIDDLNKTKEQCEQYGVKAWAIETQLDDYSSIDRLHDYVIEQGLSIDLFVLNAGISQRDKAFDTDISVDEKILKIDFLSGVYLVKKFGDMIVVGVRKKPAFHDRRLSARLRAKKFNDAQIIIDGIGMRAVNHEKSAAARADDITHSAVDQRMINLKLPQCSSAFFDTV
jgi:NAD(P)-dependent dehydrogenase (short-subunit alcohol dehydrogenase family)